MATFGNLFNIKINTEHDTAGLVRWTSLIINGK